jgi:hypothetical protein
MIKTKNQSNKFISNLFFAYTLDKTPDFPLWKAERKALNWRKSIQVEMDRYYLLEGNYNGMSIR